MHLHDETQAFVAIVNRVSERTGISTSIIEKDYYVSLVLKEIAANQNTVPAFFKGGTCLYKAYANMMRFSEDIDLTVRTGGLSRSQAKRVLERSAQDYNAIPRLKNDPLEENHRGSITAVYGYIPQFEVDIADRLQRFGKLKIEATSFTISEPTETSEIAPLLYTFATASEQAVLSQRYGILPFAIQNITLERMFADKILAAEFYLTRKAYFDVAKHIYDLTIMMEMPRILSLLNNTDKFIKALSYKREEEQFRIGSDLSEKPLKDLALFASASLNDFAFQQAYDDMQRIYIPEEKNLRKLETVIGAIEQIGKVCCNISDKEIRVNSKLAYPFAGNGQR